MTTEAMTAEALRALYGTLYDQNLDAVREDYLEFFQRKFAPAVALPPEADKQAILRALDTLLMDLYVNIQNDDEFKRRFLKAGGSESLLDAIAHSTKA